MEETKDTPTQTLLPPPASVSESPDAASSPKTTRSRKKAANDVQPIKYQLRSRGKVPGPVARVKRTTHRLKRGTVVQVQSEGQEVKQGQGQETSEGNKLEKSGEIKEDKPASDSRSQQPLILPPSLPPQFQEAPQKQESQPKPLKNEKLRPISELMTLTSPFYNPQNARSPQADKTMDGKKTIATFGKPPAKPFTVTQKEQGIPAQYIQQQQQQQQKVNQIQEQQQQLQKQVRQQTQVSQQQKSARSQQREHSELQNQIHQHFQQQIRLQHQQHQQAFQIQQEQSIQQPPQLTNQQENYPKSMSVSNLGFIPPDSLNGIQNNTLEILSPPKKKHKTHEKRTMSVAELQKEIQEIKGMLKLTLEFNSFIADELARTQDITNKERYLALKKAFVEKEWEDSSTKNGKRGEPVVGTPSELNTNQ